MKIEQFDIEVQQEHGEPKLLGHLRVLVSGADDMDDFAVNVLFGDDQSLTFASAARRDDALLNMAERYESLACSLRRIAEGKKP